jgi:hypothetical protein
MSRLGAARVHAGAVYAGYSAGCTRGTHDGWREDLSTDLRFAKADRHARTGHA